MPNRHSTRIVSVSRAAYTCSSPLKAILKAKCPIFLNIFLGRINHDVIEVVMFILSHLPLSSGNNRLERVI